MVIDSSALLAILLDEPERPAFRSALAADATRLVGAATVVEASIVVLGRLGEVGIAELETLLVTSGVVTVPFDAEQGATALEAFRRFGKGRHPAGLNFGDCLSYALARASGEPLLFKGEDFGRTDIARVT